MSIDAAVARIGEIVSIEQRFQTGGLSAVLPPPSATTGATASTGGVSFADALASAQGTSLQPSTATGGTGPVPGTVVPQTPWNPQNKPIASWIAPILQWASEHGWTGSVTSGYRTYGEQASLNASGAFSAAAGKSNHESATYPGGAVDVSNSSQLMQVLQGYTGPQKLVGGVLGPADPEHFSATGH
jgi:hypothetical protein